MCAESAKIHAYNFLGDVYQSDSKLEIAEKYFSKSNALANHLGDRFSEAHAINGLAEIALEKGEFTKAIELANKNIEISQPIENYDALAYAYQLLSKTYKSLKQYDKALENYNNYTEVSSKIFNEEKAEAIGRAEAENEYRIEKELLELEAANIKLEQEIEARNYQKKIAVLISLILIVLGIVITLTIKKRKLKTAKNNLEYIQGKIKHSQKKLLVINQEKNQLFNTVAKNLKQPLNHLYALFKNYKSDENKENTKKQIAYMLQETLFITNNLLNWASQEMREIKEEKEVREFSEIFTHVQNLLEEKIKSKELKIIFNWNSDKNCSVPEHLTKIILINLLNLIINQCQPKDEISIMQSFDEKNHLMLVIIFPKNRVHQQQILALKTKETEKNQKSFGLNLTQKIIQENNWEIELEEDNFKSYLNLKLTTEALNSIPC